jgi:hypothetical protein
MNGPTLDRFRRDAGLSANTVGAMSFENLFCGIKLIENASAQDGEAHVFDAISKKWLSIVRVAVA